MNWWTSIVSYLWRNSVNRWLEQPMVIASKLAIAGLICASGAVMMLGAKYIGDELSRQLSSRDALSVLIHESVSSKFASWAMSHAGDEESLWRGMSSECLYLYQAAGMATGPNVSKLPLYAVSDLEAYGYPDGVILVSNRLPEGLLTPISFSDVTVMATVMPPNSTILEQLIKQQEMVLASTDRYAPMLEKGFLVRVHLQAESVDAMEKMDQVVNLMKSKEDRRINMRSALPLLIQLREIRAMQGYILLVITIGVACTLGLICGALAWMEFREERYLLSLIRSFGVGRAMLFAHAVIENCIVATFGMLGGLAALGLASKGLRGSVLELGWLDESQLLGLDVFGVLILGSLLGGILSCIPVAIGLRRPLGLTLK